MRRAEAATKACSNVAPHMPAAAETDGRSSRSTLIATLAAFLLVMSACASASNATVEALDPVPSTAPSLTEVSSEPAQPTASPETPTVTPAPQPSQPSSPEQNEPAATPEVAPPEENTAEPQIPVSEAEPEESQSTCVTLADFSSDDANSQWLVVNDNVMGGRSLGDRSFNNGTMTFTGSINTNGGGFSSLRLPLPPQSLAVVEWVTVRARSDGRTYLLTFSDGLEGRSRRISFRAPMEFTTPGDWETVTIQLADLYAASFGQPVAAEPFRADLATRLGIMLSDGVDGEFELEIDSIEACRRPS